MQKLLFSILVLWVSSSIASTFNTKIHDIISPESFDQNYLILADDGVVYEIDRLNSSLVELAYEAFESGLFVDLSTGNQFFLKNSLNVREHISDIKLSSNNSQKEINLVNAQIPTPMDGYNYSTLSSFDRAIEVFKSMRTDSRWRSQCYNRAHVWSYEASRRFNLNLRKVWIFFTKKYIRNYRYKWWFHVTPAVWVDGVNEDVILDREFTRAPTEFTEWKNIFMKNNAHCPEVKYYSEYSENQWSEDCFIIKSSKYYWQPFNIENLEKGEPEKKEWVDSELGRAYRNAVRGSRDY